MDKKYPPKEAITRTILNICTRRYLNKDFYEEDVAIIIGFLKIFLESLNFLTDEQIVKILENTTKKYSLHEKYFPIAGIILEEIIKKVKNEEKSSD